MTTKSLNEILNSRFNFLFKTLLQCNWKGTRSICNQIENVLIFFRPKIGEKKMKKRGDNSSNILYSS